MAGAGWGGGRGAGKRGDGGSGGESASPTVGGAVAWVRKQELQVLQEYPSGHCCGVIKYHTGALEELDV